MPGRYSEVVMVALADVKRLVTYIAWLWHYIAPCQGNFLPLPGKKRHVGRKKEKQQEGEATRRREKLREKDYSRFYSSLFTKSAETPINTGVARGEELRTTLHPSSPLFTFGLRTELNRKLALFGWGLKPLFYVPQIYTDFPVSDSG